MGIFLDFFFLAGGVCNYNLYKGSGKEASKIVQENIENLIF